MIFLLDHYASGETQLYLHKGPCISAIGVFRMTNRIRFCLLASSVFTMTACSGGQLLIDGGLGSTCASSGFCDSGFVCLDNRCEESGGRCSLDVPDGDCPRGRLCEAGICVEDPDFVDGGGDGGNGGGGGGGFECSGCADDQLCHLGECVDPGDSSRVCSDTVLDGACPESEVCVAGSCTPIRAGKNDCSADRPDGLCPAGAFCEDGFCIPISDRPCSGVEPDGGCPAGQSCIDNACEVVECSDPDARFSGSCPGILVCVLGECRLPESLFDCDELDCAARSRGECTVDDDGFAQCGDCLPGFSEDDLGVCISENCLSLGCQGQFRECPTAENPGECGACEQKDEQGRGENYVEIDGVCELATCDNLNCEARQRGCIPGASENESAECSSCEPGFVVGSDGECRLGTCADIGEQCASQSRGCVDNSETGASCGECLPPAVEAANGRCEVCDTGDCTPCESTADCIARGQGGYCNADTRLCTIDCNDGEGLLCDNSNFLCSPNNRCAQVMPGGAVCGAGFLEGEIVEPIVGILVDRSGSMEELFNTTLPGGNGGCENQGSNGSCNIARWYAVEAILFGDTEGLNTEPKDGDGREVGTPNTSRGDAGDPDTEGLVTRFQNDIQFTMLFYSGSGSDPDEYLRMVPTINGADLVDADQIEPRLNTAADLDGPDSHRTQLAEFFASRVWTGGTPTGEAIAEASAYLRALREARGANNPLYLILATDGRPDYGVCGNPDASTIAEYLVLEAVNKARAPQTIGSETLEGITTFSLAVGSNITVNHFQDVANLGAGLPSMLTYRIPGIDDVGSLPAPGDLNDFDGAGNSDTGNPYFDAYTAPSALNGSRCDNGFAARPSLPGTPGLDVSCFQTRDNRFEQCSADTWDQSYAEFFAGLASGNSCDDDSDCTNPGEVCGSGDTCRVSACTPEGTLDADGFPIMAPCFIGNDGRALGQQLEGIFNEVLSCTIELDISDPIEDGEVFLDDDRLSRSQWRIRGVNSVEILGEACDTLKDGNPHFVSVEMNSCATGG